MPQGRFFYFPFVRWNHEKMKSRSRRAALHFHFRTLVLKLRPLSILRRLTKPAEQKNVDFLFYVTTPWAEGQARHFYVMCQNFGKLSLCLRKRAPTSWRSTAVAKSANLANFWGALNRRKNARCHKPLGWGIKLSGKPMMLRQIVKNQLVNALRNYNSTRQDVLCLHPHASESMFFFLESFNC